MCFVILHNLFFKTKKMIMNISALPDRHVSLRQNFYLFLIFPDHASTLSISELRKSSICSSNRLSATSLEILTLQVVNDNNYHWDQCFLLFALPGEQFLKIPSFFSPFGEKHQKCLPKINRVFKNDLAIPSV